MQDHSTVPYGYCHCGCGEKTNLSRQTVVKRGLKKGEPRRFLQGHVNLPSIKPDPSRGLCECGCGQRTPLAAQTKQARGNVKGYPLRFCYGHEARFVGTPVVTDTGFETPCHLWSGPLAKNGYARIKRDGKEIRLHRHYYEQAFGPIPPGYDVHHRCHQRACLNPNHLVIMLRDDHLALHRAELPGIQWRTHCKYGHEYTPENTFLDCGKYQKCVTCSRLRQQATRARKKAEKQG